MAVTVWIGSAAALGAAAEAVLDAEESRRAASLAAPEARRLFAVSRAVQRLLGARYLGIPPARVEISRSCALCPDGAGHGKPRLASAPELDYSVSHSGGLVGLAVTRDGRVGLDVEADGTRADISGLARRIASPEELRELDGMAADRLRRTLLRLWTRKEAAVKLTGYGLAVPFPHLTATGPTVRADPVPEGWPVAPVHLTDLVLEDGHPVALATTEQRPEVGLRWLSDLGDLSF